MTEGWRIWRVIDGRLESDPFGLVGWCLATTPPSDRSVDGVRMFHSCPRHASPGRGCTCGIFTWADIAPAYACLALTYLSSGQFGVLGRVQLLGKFLTESHVNEAGGFRPNKLSGPVRRSSGVEILDLYAKPAIRDQISAGVEVQDLNESDLAPIRSDWERILQLLIMLYPVFRPQVNLSRYSRLSRPAKLDMVLDDLGGWDHRWQAGSASAPAFSTLLWSTLRVSSGGDR